MATVVKSRKERDHLSLSEPQIAAVLVNQFGNGCLYVPKNQTGRIMHKASEMGLIDDNGLLTRKGRTLIARYA